MNRNPVTRVITALILAHGVAQAVEEPGMWKILSSPHFLVKFTGDGEVLAQTISERAESYYATIASDLGYTRYQNFWLWDNRVKILIYPTAQAFAAACEAPSWAAGRASYKNHEIASYNQSGEGFLTSLLPHELSHLILGDFIGQGRVPLWLTEGFAQWEQSSRESPPDLPPGAGRFPLKDLAAMDIRRDNDRHRIALFYAQSVSLVGFLVKTRGGEAFGHFCRGLRDGKPLEAALAAAYPDDLPTLDGLEAKWLKAISR